MTQAAVSVLLIVVATLFVRATFRAAAVDVGFDATGLYAISPGFGVAFEHDGAGIRNFWARAIPELQEMPGVAAVTLTELTPFDGTTKTATTREAAVPHRPLQRHARRVLRHTRPSPPGRPDLYARRSRGRRARRGGQRVAGAGVLARPLAAR